ncbi:MAG: ABC transporter permease [Pseudomonadota bacterium]|nr:ABC transporter permease [Pseudomonadota bacterium]
MIPAIARLEATAVLRARWFLAALALSAGMVGFFVLVSVRESSVLGFTGFGRVMGGVVQASLLLLPLLATFSTAQAITASQQTGVLEWYLSYPNSRGRCFWSLFLPRLAAVALPVVGAVLALACGAAVLGEPVDPALLGVFTAVLLGQGTCFASLGMLASAVSRSPEQALLRGLVVWVACAVLVDFVILGLLLQWDVEPRVVFALAGLNPMQAGRIGVLAAVEPEMTALGPVGAWAVRTLGARVVVAYGLGWPFAVGALALAWARAAFERRDVV